MRRPVATLVLAALLGGLALPWAGESHGFNDDPHWAVDVADRGDTPVLATGESGDETHCEVCHWLRTMRTAARPSSLVLHSDARPPAPPAGVDPRTRTAALRLSSARAPPQPLS